LLLSGLVLAAACLGNAHGEEREYLRLRPHKEPTLCLDPRGCVAAPRINERDSTIPGVAYPDFGRPHVFRLPPNSGRAASQYRTLGGNYGIGGVGTASSGAPVGEAGKFAEALLACWAPPEGSRGYVIMQMSLRRDGSIFGHPVAKRIAVSGDENAGKAFVAAAASAVERCAPFKLSPAFGETIAGLPFWLQFDAP
jgi:hypothetical protein